MELIFTLAMKFWQWTILIAVVIIGAIINFTDKRKKPNLKKVLSCGCCQLGIGNLQKTGSII